MAAHPLSPGLCSHHSPLPSPSNALTADQHGWPGALRQASRRVCSKKARKVLRRASEILQRQEIQIRAHLSITEKFNVSFHNIQ